MKKTLFFLILLIVAPTFSFSQLLELNLTVGETYYHNNESEISMTQDIHGESIFSEVVFGGRMSFLVKEKTDTSYHLETRFETLYMSMNINGQIMFGDSEKVDSTDILSSFFKVITESPFDLSISRQGVVLDVSMDNFFENLFNSHPHVPKLERAKMIYLLQQSFGEKAMKGSIELLTSIYPEKAVNKGDRWENKIKYETLSNSMLHNEFVLEEINSDYALINGQTKIVANDNNEFIKNNGELIRTTINGVMTSTFKIDKDSGWIIEATMNQSIKGLTEKKWREDSTIILKIPLENETTILLREE